MEVELKACPFCGNESWIAILSDDKTYKGKTYYVQCCKCLTTSDVYSTPQKAAEAWNRRSSDNNTHEIRKPFSDALYDALKAYIDCVDELKRLNAYYEAIKNAAREGKIV